MGTAPTAHSCSLTAAIAFQIWTTLHPQATSYLSTCALATCWRQKASLPITPW